MEYIFFYSSLAVVLAVFSLCIFFRKLSLPNIIIGITTIGYSLIHDIIFGDQMRLFYYITPQKSTLYMVIAAVMIYPFLNIMYTIFLPKDWKTSLLYTGFWIMGMLFFEYLSIITKTVVFTGWRPVPWSFVVYIVTYTWIYFFYKYLSRLSQRTVP